MNLAAALLEISRRTRTPLPPGVDPLQAIWAYYRKSPETVEGRALFRMMWAILSNAPSVPEADVWALGQDALALLDALVERISTGDYPP